MENKNNDSPCHALVAGQTILIDKPYTWTSFDVVSKVRNWARKESGEKKIKVGHAGTLDPLATGLLIICTGKFTKSISSIQELSKEYIGTFTLGASTQSYDLETEITPGGTYQHLNSSHFANAIQKLTGEILQIPPVFSAVKVDGKRAYEYARKKEELKLLPKSIHIYEFELTRIALPEIDFRVVCSKGTYIRSLAKDFGEILGCGAYLSALRRTRIGEYLVENAINVRDII
ncbi:MAG: tRNA pseudouridine(55) synthase TruB [Bacteroidales bacterium]